MTAQLDRVEGKWLSVGNALAVGASLTLTAAVLRWSPIESTLLRTIVTAWLLLAAAIATVDAREHRIPNKMVALLAAGTILTLGLVQLAGGSTAATPVKALAGGLVAVVLALVVHVGTSGAVGMGDVKLLFPTVALLGLFGSTAIWTALLVTVVSAGCFLALRWMARRATEPIPLAPFLIFGTAIALVAL